MLESSADGERLVISILIKSLFHQNYHLCICQNLPHHFHQPGSKLAISECVTSLKCGHSCRFLAEKSNFHFCLSPLHSPTSSFISSIPDHSAPPPSPFTFIDISALGFGVLIISIIGIKRESAFYPE